MYQRIEHVKDTVNLKAPTEVKEVITAIVNRLDIEYGIDRIDGGHVIFVETEEDLQLVCDLEIDVENCTAEYTEFIKTSTGLYTNTIFLLNNEFSVTVIIPKEITPQKLLDDM